MLIFGRAALAHDRYSHFQQSVFRVAMGGTPKFALNLWIVDRVLVLERFVHNRKRYLYYVNYEMLSIPKAIERLIFTAKNDLVVL
jgi:hypothetical protein